MTREPLLPGKPIIGVGPIRTASTWLFSVLADTGVVEYTTRKEVNYFDTNYHRGPNWYREQFTGRTRPFFVDVTPQYLDSLECCERIARDVPDGFVVLGSRDVYQRIRSMFEMFYSGHGPEVGERYRELFEYELHRQILIADRVEFLLNAFEERALILSYEQIQQNSVKAASKLLRELGIGCPAPSISKLRINSLYEARPSTVARLGRALFGVAKGILPEPIQWRMRVGIGQRLFMQKIQLREVMSSERFGAIVDPYAHLIARDARRVDQLISAHVARYPSSS